MSKHFANVQKIQDAITNLLNSGPDTENLLARLANGESPNDVLASATPEQLKAIAAFDDLAGDPASPDQHHISTVANRLLDAQAKDRAA